MKILVSEATPLQLDWLVAGCEVVPVALYSVGKMYLIDTPWKDKSRVKWIAEYSPTSNWAQGGPIIEREKLCVGTRHTNAEIHWDDDIVCWARTPIGGYLSYGPTPLIAAVRCYVASKLGNEVEIPDDIAA